MKKSKNSKLKMILTQDVERLFQDRIMLLNWKYINLKITQGIVWYKYSVHNRDVS